jgi:hypothetical protein
MRAIIVYLHCFAKTTVKLIILISDQIWTTPRFYISKYFDGLFYKERDV